MSLQDDRLGSKKSIPLIGVRRNGQPIKVVVIDDVFIDCRITSQILRSTGFDVVAEADNGKDGLIMVQHEKPSIVILDYLMPGVDGLWTLKQIRKIDPNVKVIMSTSESEKDLVIELFKEGATAYIVKPIDRTVVLEKLKKVVDELH
ncbi:MAG: response regulator [Spirochaetaceae bacterium]